MKSKRKVVGKRRKGAKRGKPRILPTPSLINVSGSGLTKRKNKKAKRGGYLVPLVTGGLAAATGIVQAWKSIQNSKRVLQENQRHHRELEKILKEKNTLNLRSGSGLKRRRRGKKCRKNKISFL